VNERSMIALLREVKFEDVRLLIRNHIHCKMQDMANDVNVYIISSGVNAYHEDFLTADGTKSRVVAAYTVDPASPASIDIRGEGTLAAGLVAGRSQGVAKGATVHSVKVFRDDTAYAVPKQDVIDALAWVKARMF
jgi:subtilisin family serine protease